MCGILGYVGPKPAGALILKGLRLLEYRGYDSVGIATIEGNHIDLRKDAGRVDAVEKTMHFEQMKGTYGIGHTRWATHGPPVQKNAHPFVDESGQFVLIHNGIIENYLELKEELRSQGVNFSSDTDSEVLVHLIAKVYRGDLLKAVFSILPRLQGAYSLCVLHTGSREIIGARNGSPLIVGVGEGENFFASDVAALVEYTRRVIYVRDFEVVRITDQDVISYTFEGKQVANEIKEVHWSIEQAQKQGYKHFMIKEISEQDKVVEESLKVRFSCARSWNQVYIVACGGASFVSVLGKYIIEQVAQIPVSIDLGSEFRYRVPIVTKGDLVVVISQSGETADTLAAVRLAKQRGAHTLGVINVVGSTIAREVDEVVYTRTNGPEISVASTKAFLAQCIAMYQLAYHLAGKTFEFEGYSSHIISLIELSASIKSVSQRYALYQNFLFIGRNRNFPLALEGALKLKEIAYIHAEAYPGGELKHGPLALVCEDMPTFAICPQDEFHDKMLSNIQEVKARRGRVVALGTIGDGKLAALADDIFYLPKVDPLLYPLLESVVLHLFAYHIADMRECDIDKPRNLAKSVTVE
ncbi:glutamine--fructose-6-phosphate transaminase (isomerizing) [Candidatus Woesearchaeota archaeon]|nr:glutamine--fructose-6-phosphate transaminase (isomerizing) [Candidatus Woesearchaeota archaeon]